MTLFKGSGVALVTPFKNGKINYHKLTELIEWHIKKKTDAIVICGTTGESSTLSEDEKKELIRYTVKVADGRIPVIAGTGTNDTLKTIELSVYAESVGVNGLLIVTPYYNKTTQRGIIRHYEAVANEVSIPIIIYSVEGRTGLNIDVETVLRLSKHPNIVGIKEASGNIGQVVEIASLVDHSFSIYSGNDDQIVPVLAVGGVGVISVLANMLPEETHMLVKSYLTGNVEKSKSIQLTYNKLIKTLFIETNPVPIKEALNILGLKVGKVRLPLVEMSSHNRELLLNNMTDLGLIQKE